MKSRYIRKAWYLDDDVLIEGYVDKRGFHPNKEVQCGFELQKINRRMVGREIFYNINKALSTCNNVEVSR